MQPETTPTGEKQSQLVSECAGRPARISFFRPETSELLTRVYGAIDEIHAGQPVTFDCDGVMESVPPGCPTVVEVMVRSEFIILHTNLQSIRGGSTVVLDWPHEVTQQRRQHPRVDVEVPMHFIVGGALPARSGSMNNLSAGGLAFVTAEQVAVGAELTIAFGLGSGCYFTGIQGAVVRCSPLIDGRYQTAVRFAALHPDTFAQLRDWVEEQAGKAGHAARPE